MARFRRLPALVALALAVAAPAPAQAVNDWALSPDRLTTARWMHGVAAVPGGGLLAAGGLTGPFFPGNATRTVERYDGTAWAPVAPMAVRRAQTTAVTGPDGRVYVLGGFDAAQITASAEAYDPVADDWTTVESMPGARTGVAAVVGPDDEIYVFGGSPTGTRVATHTAWRYSPLADSWIALPDMPEARADHMAVLAPDDRIYVFGGITNQPPPRFISPASTRIDRFDPAAGMWTRVGRMPKPLAFAAAVTANGYAYVAGGEKNLRGRTAVSLYDPVEGTWTCADPLPEPRAWLAGALDGGAITMVGGGPRDDQPSAKVFTLPVPTPDVTPPEVVRAPRPGLVAGGRLPAGGVRVRLSWKACDDGSPVDAYTLERRLPDGDWAPLPVGDAAARTHELTFAPGENGRFRVSAADEAGNVSAAAEGSRFRVTLGEETSGSIRYRGGWDASGSAGASGGRVRSATAEGARATFRFTGRAVAWVSTRGPSLGKARVFVDGAFAGRVDLHRAARSSRQVVFARSFARAGEHRLRIVVSGTPGHPRVDVDAFAAVR